MADETMKEIRIAIQNDDISAVKSIVANCPGILNELSPLGSVLQIAARDGKTEIAKFIMDSGSDVDFGGGLFKKTPIADAAFNGHLKIVEMLADKGAELDTSSFENNPLFAAIYSGHADVAKYLIDKGIDVAASYPLGEIEKCDACEYARQYGLTEVCDYLKKRKQS